ncbi:MULTISPECIES: glutaredoxin 3 [Prochlorococcus]|uniref:Glutaredoxin n=1 Tax=Prochlorococcus marinus (strain SARG / CCMP1375 / SS120) TaxID=167539 RepID=Q7VE11_PROMA|nr:MULTISPECIES: glutaredoxin 3 [Prochlorococcus]AAP99250.1 Glutaredoxin [Prochlorococcus marinus subsp. marinus str. CCMP1375]KGG32714.1 Glutaredoxin 3 (Grx1) [Prochlorococcus marinus str. SS51]KGG37104.1 Glutaredoxin 3 (Grx1) [Prochlorococcus sp. SS52]
MAKVEIYTWQYCPFCIRAKALLDLKKIDYDEYPIDGNQAEREKMSIRAKGKTTVPQIFINNQSVGGCDELYALEESNQLDNLINQNK